jgi:hypothetical protein
MADVAFPCAGGFGRAKIGLSLLQSAAMNAKR